MSNRLKYLSVSDEALFRDLRSDQRDALTELFDRYHRKLFFFALKFLKDKEMAKDAVQSVFVKCWESRHKMNIKTSVSNYLFMMLKHRVLNDIRSKNAAITRNYILYQHSEVVEADCSKRLEEGELTAEFHRAIRSLPEQKRRVCLYKMRGDMSNEDIANEMELSIATVKSHYSEAIKKLRDMMTNQEGNE